MYRHIYATAYIPVPDRHHAVHSFYLYYRNQHV